MKKGICRLSAIPMRAEPSDKSEMVNQVLFGETYTIKEQRQKWAYISLQHDSYEGWIDQNQHLPLGEDFIQSIENLPTALTADLIELVSQKDGGSFFPIFLGSMLPGFLQHGKVFIDTAEYNYEGPTVSEKLSREEMVEMAYLYLHAPYLWGGRTPFGIDCSAFIQMVYRLAGYQLPRDASDQAGHGLTLSFIEEAEPGDLAFFDNEEGYIVHVGVILKDNYIIHASGKVRLDRLDQSGIFNREKNTHTHKLRVIKKII